jgi:hypothetical protein
MMIIPDRAPFPFAYHIAEIYSVTLSILDKVLLIEVLQCCVLGNSISINTRLILASRVHRLDTAKVAVQLEQDGYFPNQAMRK